MKRSTLGFHLIFAACMTALVMWIADCLVEGAF